ADGGIFLFSAQQQTIAEFEIATLNLRAANAERETVQLEAAVAGRRLTSEQIATIAASLRQFAGRELFVTSYSGDAEAARLGLQIVATLKRAGLRPANELGRSVATGGGVVFGIHISGPQEEKGLVNAITQS